MPNVKKGVVMDRLKELFFSYLDEVIEISEVLCFIFEQDEFMDQFHPDDYEQLFKIKVDQLGNRYELSNILFKYFSQSEYETQSFLRCLHEAKENPHQLPKYLQNFYELYCSGYTFLEVLGLDWGLDNRIMNWDHLNEVQKEKWLDNNFQKITQDIDQVIEWITQEKIILLGEHDEYNCLKYIDKRTEQDKKKSKKEGFFKRMWRFFFDSFN